MKIEQPLAYGHLLKKKLLIFGLFLTVFCAQSFAQDRLPYDKYASIYRDREETQAEGGFKDSAAKLLVYPFQLLKWPVDKTLVYVEKNHIPEKIEWAYNTIQDYGITPYARIGTFDNLGAGADIDLIRLARRKEQFPDATARTWIHWNSDVVFDVGSEVGLKRIAESPFYTLFYFQYEDRPEEHFYGIGPDTSAGDGTAFRMEDTVIEPTIGFNPNPSWVADMKFGYYNVNITESDADGKGVVDAIFFPRTIPGLEGDEFVAVSGQINRDTRNYKENSTRGSDFRLQSSFNEGVDGSDARWFKFLAEGTKFFSLGSERRIGVIHLYGEHNNELENHYVPFHQMAKLGGYGTYPRMSRTLRGYDFNRFFDESALLANLEYRYAVWEYKEVRADAVLFFDEGQVFDDVSEFQLRDFRESYGVGIRFSVARIMVFLTEIAKSDEGYEFYLKSTTPF